jgi:hypothetical protein
LTGVNKVFPLYTETPDEGMIAELNNLFRLSHFKDNYNIQIQALRFIYQMQKA